MNKNHLSVVLGITILILTLLWSLLILINPSGTQLSIFHARLSDFYSDFFNVLHYISDRNPYYNTYNGYEQKVYFPLSYLILYPFSQLDSFGKMTLNEMWNSKIGLFSAFFFTTFSLFLLYYFLNKLLDLKYKNLILLSFFISYINIFSIERGNLIILTVAGVSSFLLFYDSNDSKLRYFAIICLAFATTLKIYPFILGFLLLKQKKYKEIGFAVLFTLILIFLPFFFFKNGLENINQLLHNLKLNSEIYSAKNLYPRFGIPHLVYLLTDLVNLSPSISNLWIILAKYFTILLSIISVWYMFVIKEKWIQITLLLIVIIQLPTNSALYTGLYFFPAIILFLNYKKDRRITKFDIIYTVLLIIFLNPIQIKFHDYSITYCFTSLSLFAIWILFLYRSIILRSSLIDK
jgi:hypothetical protein